MFLFFFFFFFLIIVFFFFFFFFSSRRRHTRLQGDWSSDVCSSDLGCLWFRPQQSAAPLRFGGATRANNGRKLFPLRINNTAAFFFTQPSCLGSHYDAYPLQ